jgi:DNA-binding CsgD family transcriptional regulator
LLTAGRGAIVAGTAGVGKTRLVQEALRRHTGDRPIVRIRATRAAAAIPLGAFATLLPADIGETTDDTARLRRAIDAVVAVGDGSGIVLVVDDVQALDEASAALTLGVAAGGRALLVGTLRAGDGAPDAVVALWKDEIVERVDLEPLDEDTVGELLGEVLPGGVDRLSVSVLHRASGGNPLYLRELLDGLFQEGVLVKAGGLWTIAGPLTAPPRLAELVESRLEDLSETERFVLEIVALGEPIGITSLEARGWGVAGESLDRLGLVDVIPDGRRRQLRVSHPVYADAVRAHVTGRTRQAILGGLVSAIEESGLRRREDARRVAAWRLEAGLEADPQVLLAAARDARVADDFESSIRYAQAAADGGAGFDAEYLLGRALDMRGRHAEAEDTFGRADRSAADDTARVLVALGRSENRFRGLGQADAAYELLDKADADVTEPDLQAQLTGHRAMLLFFEGRVRDVLALAEPLLDQSVGDVAFCHGALQVAMALLHSGRVTQALDVSRRAFEVRIELGDHPQLGHPGVYLVAHSLALAEDGQIDAAIKTAIAGYDGARLSANRDGQAWFATALAKAEMYAGRLEDAARSAREVALAFGEKGHPGARWGHGAIAAVHGQRADATAASDAIADLDAEPPTTLVTVDAEIELGRAWTLAAMGDVVRAASLARGGADIARARGQRQLELAALHDVARLGAAGEVLELTVECARAVDGGLAPLRLAYVEGVVGGDAAELEAAADGFEACGALLWAAEAANEAAIAHRARGEARPAQAAMQRAKGLAARCQDVNTPALAHGTEAAVLTRREREIATLAARGQSNRDIAESLVVSPRTVENHLQRAYEKLGVNRREQLADALARAGY